MVLGMEHLPPFWALSLLSHIACIVNCMYCKIKECAPEVFVPFILKVKQKVSLTFIFFCVNASQIKQIFWGKLLFPGCSQSKVF